MPKFNQKDIVKLNSDKYQKAVADARIAGLKEGVDKRNPFNLLGSDLFKVPNGSVAPSTEQFGTLGAASGGLVARGRDNAPMYTQPQQQGNAKVQTGEGQKFTIRTATGQVIRLGPNTIYNPGAPNGVNPTGLAAVSGDSVPVNYGAQPASNLQYALRRGVSGQSGFGTNYNAVNPATNATPEFNMGGSASQQTAKPPANAPAGERWFSTANLAQEAAYAISQGYVPQRIEPRVAASLKANGIDVSTMYDTGGNLVNPQGGASYGQNKGFSNYNNIDSNGNVIGTGGGVGIRNEKGMLVGRNRHNRKGNRYSSGYSGSATQDQIQNSPTSYGLVNWNVKFG